jgi:tryptophanyl-tRNA synthetase
MRERVLSGMRPTGRLHIGHVEGVLRNWVELQKNNDCFYFVADWHALTTNPDTREIKRNTYEMVKDWLAMGVNPEKSTLFIQSAVPEHAELHLVFSMLNSLARLERLPTFKEQIKELDMKESIPYGFLGYPVLQAADILMYKTKYVPVGEDQLPHIELTRETARRFNGLYGEVFPVPMAELSEAPRILGTDGRKMSKSYKNEILPTDDKDWLVKKVRTMTIDPQRQKTTDPGNPEACSVYDLHKIYNKETTDDIAGKCRTAGRGCGECKMLLPDVMAETYKDYRERRKDIGDELVMRVLKEGNEKARAIASQTMNEVRRAMLLNYLE